MDLTTWMLMDFTLFIALLDCHAQKSLTENAAIGQDVVIPCGIQVKEPLERLVWKLGDVNDTVNLAHSFQGLLSCNTQKRQNCDLRPDGSLVLYNVQKSDGDDYFCVVDREEKYYSQHTLVVHPEVAFETCLNPEDVFVTQTGPDEKVVAYTNPVCRNTDVIGTVTCDPPSGDKIDINVTEIVCTCSHSANVVDTCEIHITDVSPSANCSESDSICGSKDDGIVCPQVAAFIFLGIFIGAVPGGVVRLIEYFYKKHSLKPSADEEKNRECEEMLDETATRCTQQNERNTKPELRSCLQPDMTIIQGEPLELKFSVIEYPTHTILWFKDGKQLDPQAGYKVTFSDGVAMLTVESTKEGDEGMFLCVVVNPKGSFTTGCNVMVEKTAMMQPSDENGTVNALPCTDPNESGIIAVDTPDLKDQTDTQHSLPTCTGISEFVVEDISPKFRILPSRTNPTEGIAISCNRDGKLTVGFQKGDLLTITKPCIDPFIGGMTISVADTVAVPVHINCLKCGNSCCTLEVNGSEWSKKQPETDCKITCNEKDAEEI